MKSISIGICRPVHINPYACQLQTMLMKGCDNLSIQYTVMDIESLHKSPDILFVFNTQPRGTKALKHQQRKKHVLITLKTGVVADGATITHKQRQSLFKTNPGSVLCISDIYHKKGCKTLKYKDQVDDRAKKLGFYDLDMQPWKTDSKKEFVLLIQQLKPDGYCYKDRNWIEWAKKTSLIIKKTLNIPIKIKSHPNREYWENKSVNRNRKKKIWKDLKKIGEWFPINTTLEESLKNSIGCIMLSSKAWLEATLFGYPIHVENTCALGHQISNPIAELRNAKEVDRKQWLNNMAYSHWKPSELESGEYLQHTLEQLRQHKMIDEII